MSLTSLNPPNPGVPLFDTDDKSLGHSLLRLVRLAEKSDAKSADDLTILLKALGERFVRRGLLGGDIEKAEAITAAGINTTNAGNANNNKRGQKRKNKSVDETEADGNSGDCDDVNLLLSALVRLAGGNQDLSSPRTLSSLPRHLIVGGFDACVAALQHLLSCPRQSPCAVAEYELIGGVARALLTGVSRTVKAFVESSVNSAIVISGFRAANLIVALYGSRLTRNQTILSSLRQLAWNVMCTPDSSIQQQVASFLAALPLTGMDKSTPSNLWSSSIVDGASALYLLLEAAVPLKNSKASRSLDKQKAQEYMTDPMKAIISSWIDQLEADELGSKRQSRFTTLVSGVSCYMVSLFNAQSLVAQESTVMSSAQLAVVEVMDLLEDMISFPSLAENLYYGTKKRLRFEIIEGGLFNPHETCEAANSVKSCGLEIFDAMLESVGRAVLLPFGKRAIKLSHSSLLSACSVPLRYAIDPTTSLRTDGKRQKWLHLSTEMKTRSIRSFRATICTLGSNALVSQSSSETGSKRGKSNQSDKCVALVIGCLLEQLLSSHTTEDSWGSSEERGCLIVAAMEAITTVLTVGGGFLSFGTRTLIDSTIQSSLQKQMDLCASDNLFLSSDVKVACLKLASVCIVAPWSDGAGTSLFEPIRDFARSVASDADAHVSSEARLTLELIRSTNAPRAPPLLLVTRSSNENLPDAAGMAERLHIAHEAMKKTTKKVEEPASNKLKRKKDDKNSDDVSTVKKRFKQEVRPSVDQTSGPELLMTADDKESVQIRDDAPTLTDDASVEEPKATPDLAREIIVTKIEETGGDDDEMDFMPSIVDDGPDDGD